LTENEFYNLKKLNFVPDNAKEELQITLCGELVMEKAMGM
jgi:hypothetical protein